MDRKQVKRVTIILKDKFRVMNREGKEMSWVDMNLNYFYFLEKLKLENLKLTKIEKILLFFCYN